MVSTQDAVLGLSPEARHRLASLLLETRAAAALSQRTVAARLGRSPSHVHMIETGRRRLDALELFRFAQACGADPIDFFAHIAERLGAADTPNASARGGAR